MEATISTPEPSGKKVCQHGIARIDISYGRREPDLGCTAHSWRIENGWIRYLGANRAAMDAKSPEAPGAGKTMGDVSE